MLGDRRDGSRNCECGLQRPATVKVTLSVLPHNPDPWENPCARRRSRERVNSCNISKYVNQEHRREKRMYRLVIIIGLVLHELPSHPIIIILFVPIVIDILFILVVAWARNPAVVIFNLIAIPDSSVPV